MTYSVLRLLPLAALFGLAACASPFGPSDGCGAADLSEFIGQPAVEVAAIESPGPVRILGPRSVATMDFNPTRLNILTDEDGIVTALSCG